MDEENQNAQYSSNQFNEGIHDNSDHFDTKGNSDTNNSQILDVMNYDDSTVLKVMSDDTEKAEDALKLRDLNQDSSADETINVDSIFREIPSAESSSKRNTSIGSGEKEGSSRKSSDLTVHSKNVHKCNVCQKAFVNEGNLKVHLRVHTGVRPYKCSECGKLFSQKCHLDQHLRIHTGEKPYKCTECGKLFNQKPNLDVHLRIHTGEKPYGCTLCGKSFYRKQNLDRHFRGHAGEKLYKCNKCKKSFTRKTSLNNHIRKHTKESRYECRKCGKSFTQKCNLDDHLKIHTRESSLNESNEEIILPLDTQSLPLDLSLPKKHE